MIEIVNKKTEKEEFEEFISAPLLTSEEFNQGKQFSKKFTGAEMTKALNWHLLNLDNASEEQLSKIAPLCREIYKKYDKNVPACQAELISNALAMKEHCPTRITSVFW